MKESQSRDKFNEISAEFAARPETKALVAQLGVLRDTVRELQDDGLSVSLEVRPDGYKSPIPFTKDICPLANGTICVEGVDIEFALTRAGDTLLRFGAYLGSAEVACNYIYDTDNFRHTLNRLILGVDARRRVLEAFNLDESGNAGPGAGKNLVISPPIKLKKPEAP